MGPRRSGRSSTAAALVFLLAAPVAAERVLLVLGSHRLRDLERRVELARGLAAGFDRVIVSGKCGAHGSELCEAERMATLLGEGLAAAGAKVPPIVQETRAGSTAENLCFSRPLIRPGDRITVLSNHPHVIPVAACLGVHTGVEARYHYLHDYEGGDGRLHRGVAPHPREVVADGRDYGGIAAGCLRAGWCARR